MLTVSDILRLEELELTLVAGAERVSAPVRWVHSSELADPTPWLRGSELLLTTGRPLEDAPERFVELLAESGLAGLGLGLGFGFEECPAEARAAADRLGFPVFTIPYEIPFIAITEAVFTGLSNQRVAETERRLAGDLVEAIVAGDISARELRRRTRAFGLRGTLPLTFVMLRADGGGTHTLARVADAVAGAGPTSVRDGIVAVLIEAPDDAAAEARAAELLATTAAVAAGVGRVRDQPGQLPRCYDEALYALDAHRPGGTPAVATFRELGSMQLLLSLQDERAIELYCDAVLGPLVTHDAVHGSELIETLRAYIEANGRWAEAAAAMNVHRHTLRYRVRKIEQLTGRDLSAARDRMELWLALRADQLSRQAGAGRLSVVSVVGAAGIIGPAIVATLAEHDAVTEIRCLDINPEGAAEVAARYGAGKAVADLLDIRDQDAAAATLAGSNLLLNTAAYRINLDAMRAALQVGCHYLDLGGLFHVTGEQLELDARVPAKPGCWRCWAWARPPAKPT